MRSYMDLKNVDLDSLTTFFTLSSPVQHDGLFLLFCNFYLTLLYLMYYFITMNNQRNVGVWNKGLLTTDIMVVEGTLWKTQSRMWTNVRLILWSFLYDELVTLLFLPPIKILYFDISHNSQITTLKKNQRIIMKAIRITHSRTQQRLDQMLFVAEFSPPLVQHKGDRTKILSNITFDAHPQSTAECRAKLEYN